MEENNFYEAFTFFANAGRLVTLLTRHSPIDSENWNAFLLDFRSLF